MSDPTLKKATGTMPTVKFNVGGRLYEVPRSLVEKFPSTMLARMASGTWQKDPEATLFIGRSGERFEYSLDYMRADKVWLPLNIPKEALLDDLDFYGFENVDPRKIHGGSSNLAAAQHLHKCKEEHEEVLSTCKRKVKAAETNIDAAERTIKCEEVAYECFVRFSQGKSFRIDPALQVAIDNQVDLSKSILRCRVFSQGKSFSFESNDPALHHSAKVAVANQAVFQDHLAKYGLAFVKGGYHGPHGYALTLKEKEDTIN
jgi:hypothetical protein